MKVLALAKLEALLCMAAPTHEAERRTVSKPEQQRPSPIKRRHPVMTITLSVGTSPSNVGTPS
jgi:hypothetical protein